MKISIEMDISDSIKRISAMEQALNDSSFAIEELFAAIERYKTVLPKLAELEEYYQSPLWLKDLDDDRAGRLPEGLCRGVLSQDAVYDLLSDSRQLISALSALAESKEDNL